MFPPRAPSHSDAGASILLPGRSSGTIQRAEIAQDALAATPRLLRENDVEVAIRRLLVEVLVGRPMIKEVRDGNTGGDNDDGVVCGAGGLG